MDMPLARPFGHSLRVPSPERSPAPELASEGGFFIFMFWYFRRGLESPLQRGHTQADAG